MYILVYVDDIILVSSSAAAADRLVVALRDDFAVKDLGALHFFLGLEVSRSSAGLTLTQKKYSLDLLRRAGMLKCKPVFTPMSAADRLSALDGDSLSRLMMLLSIAVSLVVCNTLLLPGPISPM